MELDTGAGEAEAPLAKFADPDWTAKREPRATVALDRLDTLWINTGTLCNITCQNCYIESSPSNDRLVYITAAEVAAYLDEIVAHRLGTREIAFTGGEPFMNPQLLAMLEGALSRGFEALVLTNAMQPMQRPKTKQGLLALRDRFGARLKLRVSLDHHTAALHEAERGTRTWAKTIAGLDWLARNGFAVAIAGRTCWNESEAGQPRRLRAPDRRQGLADRPAQRHAAGAAAGDGRRPRCAGDHHPLLGDPRQAAGRHDVRHQPHGHQAPGSRAAERGAVHAHSLRRGVRDGADAGRRGARAGRHVRGRRRQAVPSALLEVLRARRRQLLGALRLTQNHCLRGPCRAVRGVA